MIVEVLKELVIQIIIFYLYRWSIFIIHELAHFAVSKCLGYKCYIKIRHSRFLMPRCSVIIRGKIRKTQKQDIIFSASGIVVAEIVTICLLVLCIEYKNALMIFIAHIPILLLDMIPLGGNDGEWVIKDMAHIRQWKEKVSNTYKKAIVIAVFAVTIGAAVVNTRILFNIEKNQSEIIVSALFILVFTITTMESLWRNAKEIWKRCEICTTE